MDSKGLDSRKRRDVIKTIGAAGTTAALGGAPMIWTQNASAQTLAFKPEKGAKLRVLRWKRFVQADEDVWMANTKKFTEKYGVEVRTDHEGWEDVRPKAAVAANVGAGPDVIVGWLDDPHLYPDKLLDLTDLAEYLDKKYGGWFPAARTYGTTAKGRWIGLPLGAGGALLNYRISWVKEAGFDKFPSNFDDYLKLCQALQKNGHPAGFALSHATGDSETWMHNMLWGFGGRLVDEKSKVAINSPETVKAIEYMQQLTKTFIEGVASWSGVSNNNAFLEGKISLTSNGISIYYAAKNSADPAKKAIVGDMDHAAMPIGPIGRPTELHLLTQAFAFKYSKYPNAAKEFLRFMWEREQYEPWQAASLGYISHPLRAYDNNKFWGDDPKYAPFKGVVSRLQPHSYAGGLGYASAACLADWIVVDMFASACTGKSSPKEAAAEAERRAKRYYV
jgi:multiple sugar transport system substrate-binding protein